MTASRFPSLVVFILLFAPTSNIWSQYKIYYIPLETEIYEMMTPSRIEKCALYEMDLKSRKIDALFHAIDTSTQHINATHGDSLFIRIKVIDKSHGKDLFISTDKEILCDGRKYFINDRIVEPVVKLLILKSKSIKRRF